MFKRLFWLMIGAGFGFGLAMRLTRTVRRTVDRFSPDNIASTIASALRDFGADLRAAVTDGRQAMVEREAELRAELDARRLPAAHRPELPVARLRSV